MVLNKLKGLIFIGILLFSLFVIRSIQSSRLIIKQHAASSPGAISISVDGATATGTMQTQLSTNNVWSYSVDQAPNGQSLMNSLKAPLVRIHVGDDGGNPVMPEKVQNVWANAGETRPFQNLDVLVNNVFVSGQQPVMNIKFAPDWMWTCTTLQTAGTVRDTTFQTFADYMARVVSYYNKGTMTTETGTVITNPSGTSHKITWWELWNEPDLSNETPCVPPTGNALTPSEYVTMWNAVTTKMLAVDPTIKFVGPATAGSQFGSSPATGNQYVDQLMTSGTPKPDALSFHGYGYWDNTVSDQWIFDGDNSDPANACCGGVKDILNGVNSIHGAYPALPIWITEINVNAAWGDDTYKRPWSEFGVAWWGSMFQQLAQKGVALIHQFDVADSPQFGLFDDATGNTYQAYWTFQLLNQDFPSGSTILSSSSTKSDVQQLAVRKPDGNISVLVVNRQVGTGASNCGTGGLAATVTVNLQGITPKTVTLKQMDKHNVNCSTNYSTAPTAVTLPVSNTQLISFSGYGIAVLEITPNSTTYAPTATPIPTSTPNPTNTIIPTITPIPSNTKVSLVIKLHGIGKGGDSVNAASSGTTSPLHSSRTVNISLFDTSNTALPLKTGTLTYQPNSGDFRGTVDLGSTPTGFYTGKVRMASYLSGTIPGIISLTLGQITNLPTVSLVAGDANTDGKMDILDYNMIMDCYSDFSPAKNCDSTKKLQTDLTDDNSVNSLDLNLFLREMSVRQ